jgi:UDP-N-acetylglucosamine:LPS N-acetylglucosamine transferase
MAERERVLFLYLKTGGGHLSAARALSASLEERGKADTFLLDGIPDENKLQHSIVVDGYSKTGSQDNKIWIFIYEASRWGPLMRLYTALMAWQSGPHIKKFIQENGITRVVVLHFLLKRAAVRALHSLRKSKEIPVITVITDPFTPHPLWYQPPVTDTVVFTDMLYRKTIYWYNYPASRTVIFPPILNRQFERRASEEEIVSLKNKYGFSRNKRLILMAGGGDGLPKGINTLRSLAKSSLDIEIAFVSGKNKEQLKAAKKIVKKTKDKKITVYGFVDFMYELMSMADVVITKGGPATVLETLMLRKPLILTNYIYGQERGNLDFVKNNQLGHYISSGEEVIEAVRDFISDPETYEKAVSRICRVDIRNGSEKIADFVMEFDKVLPRNIKEDDYPRHNPEYRRMERRNIFTGRRRPVLPSRDFG